MLNRRNDGLSIFTRFQTDRSLPKHLKPTKDKFDTELNDSGVFFTIGEGTNPASDESWGEHTVKSNNFFSKIKKWISSKFKRWFDTPKYSAIVFFELIKNGVSSSVFDKKLYDTRVSGYLESITQATNAGQTALLETLKSKLSTVKIESLLYASGAITIITEEQVVGFVKKSENGIRLDWIKNFNRTIPSKVVDRKVQMDGLKVFDNYVVMHYDPDKKSWKETEAEKEKREDPILFGVISGSTKLYFIADWTDKFCDLTLTDFIDTFGKDAINKNNITVNI